MGEKKKKKTQWQKWFAVTFMCLIGAGCGFLMAAYMEGLLSDGKEFGEALCGMALLFVGMYIAYYLQIVFHEVGHLIFGLLSGYRFSSFRVGNFMWIHENGKLRFKRYSLAGTGGQCLMSPPDLVDGKMPVILYNLGGSLNNIIVSVICIVLYLVLGSDSLIGMFFLIAAIVGIGIALINGIPLRLGEIDNDGYNAFSLGKNEAAMRSIWIQLKIQEQLLKGVKVKDMPKEWFAFPSDEGMKNSMVAALGVFACNRLMEEHHFEVAEKEMQRLLNMDTSIVGVHRSLLICDCVFCELIGENRREKVDAMLDKQQKKIMKAMKTNLSVLRTEYAYALLAEKDGKKAGRIKAQFEKHAAAYPYPGEVESERELIQIAK